MTGRFEEQDYAEITRFGEVDEVDEGEQFLLFLDRVDGYPDVQARRRRTYELLGARPGLRVLEAGCGTGTAARELAELVAPAGSVTAIDVSEELIAVARRRATRLPGLELRVGDALDLPVADGSVDAYRAERTLQHVADPAKALAEAFRVVRPGGRVVVVDQDYDTVVVDADDRETTRAVVRTFADSIRNGWLGRAYRRLLLDAGFAEVSVEGDAQRLDDPELALRVFMIPAADGAVEAGLVTRQAAGAWLADQRARADNGRLYVAMTHFVATATRP